MSERMLLVSRFGGQFHADDGHACGKHIRDVVHRIEQDGEGIRKQSDGCLETGQEDIDADSCPACPYDCLFSVLHLSIVVSGRMRLCLSLTAARQ